MSSALAEVLRKYPFKVGTVTELTGGSINRVYAVKTNRGEFVLKHYLGADSRQVAIACTAQALAQANGLPVPRVIPNSAGENLTRVASRDYVMSERLAGNSVAPGDLSERAARNLGLALARLLDVLASIKGDAPASLPDKDAIISRLQELIAIAEARGRRVRLITSAFISCSETSGKQKRFPIRHHDSRPR